MHGCKHFLFNVYNPNSKALCLCVGLQHGHVGSLCYQSIHESLIFKSIFIYTYVHIQRPRHKSKPTVCCYAVTQHFLRSLLSLFYCIFDFKSGQKGDLPGTSQWVFATQFPLKLSVGFCCEQDADFARMQNLC